MLPPLPATLFLVGVGTGLAYVPFLDVCKTADQIALGIEDPQRLSILLSSNPIGHHGNFPAVLHSHEYGHGTSPFLTGACYSGHDIVREHI